MPEKAKPERHSVLPNARGGAESHRWPIDPREKEYLLALCQRAEIPPNLLDLLIEDGTTPEVEAMIDDYAGQFSRIRDFVLSIEADDAVPQSYSPHVDRDAVGRDLELEGTITIYELGAREFHIFYNSPYVRCR